MDVFSLGLLVDVHDDHLQHEQGLVNVLGLINHGLVLDAGLSDALGTRQIDQMQFGHCLHIGAQFLAFDLDHKDAMRTGRGIVLGGL